jgi:hypothetical protein
MTLNGPIFVELQITERHFIVVPLFQLECTSENEYGNSVYLRLNVNCGFYWTDFH